MGTIGIVILCGIGVLSIGVVFAVFFSKKKKKKADKKEKANSEPKVEPVYKSQKPEEPKEEAKEEKPKVEMPTEFKIIRKKSEVKVNKKALKAGSRNPSITRVFVNGKNVDEPEKPKEEEPKSQIKKKSTLSDIARANIGRFGTREPVFDDLSKPAVGAPNRAPIIGDRTNFGSHLRSENDNSDIIANIGAKTIEENAKREKALNERTEKMMDKVKNSFLGDVNDDAEMFLNEPNPKVSEAKEKLQKLDAQTLILADAVLKRKGK